jgi:ribonuclease BN (tRNA processing enzyme)
MVYATDTEDQYHDGAANPVIALARGADLLIHDAQYVDADRKPGWGHSTMEAAIDVALHASVRQLVLYHHDPERSDDALDEIGALAARVVERRHGKLRVTVAREGLEITL